MEAQIVTRIQTSEPMVLVPLKEYRELLDKVEDDYLEIVYKVFGTLFATMGNYTGSSGNSLQQDFESFLSRNYPYLTLETVGRGRETKLKVSYNNYYTRSNGRKSNTADTDIGA